MRFLVVEPDPGGHRLVYVRYILRHLLASDQQVVLAVSSAVADSKEFRKHLSDLGAEAVPIIPVAKSLEPRALAEIADGVRADVVIVPDGDRFASKLAFRGWTSRSSVRVLIMQDPRLEMVAFFSASSRPSLFRVCKMSVKMLVLSIASRRKNVRLLWLRGAMLAPFNGHEVPDPVSAAATKADALEYRSHVGLSDDVYWFGMAGGINERKNPALVVEALAGGPADQGIAFTGPMRESLRQSLEDQCASAGVRAVFDTRLLSDADMNVAIAAVDCVVVAYSTHNPPSTLGKAVSIGKPVAVAGSRSLRAHARDLGVDQTSNLQLEALRSLLAEIRRDERPSRATVAGPSEFAQALTGVYSQQT